MNIPAQTITTLYVDAVALLLLGGMFVLAGERWHQRDTEGKLFGWMFLLSMANALTNGFSYLLHYQHFAGIKTLALFVCTIVEGAVLLFLAVWLVYVDYSLYHSRDHIKRVFVKWFAPMTVSLALLVINLFTGIVFSVNDDIIFSPTLLFKVIEVTEYAYLIASVVVFSRFYREHGAPRFFRLWTFLLPILFGSFVTDLTPYSLRSLGIAVGIVTLFFSTENYRRFLDSSTGLYNEEYMRWLAALPEGKSHFNGAILFTTEELSDGLVKLIRQEAPEQAELVLLEDRRILLLSQVEKKSVLRLIGDNICFAAEDADVMVDATEQIRGLSETPQAFLTRVCGSTAESKANGEAAL